LSYTRLFNSFVLLSVVIHVVKARFREIFTAGSIPVSAGVPRASGTSSEQGMDEARALPNHPRYQLR